MTRRIALVLLVLAACVGDDPVESAASPDAGGTPDSGTVPSDSGAGVDTSSPAVDGGTDAPSCLAPASGMISWWTGDDTLVDRLGNNNMTVVGDGGTVGYGAGQVGKAFLFDGTARLERNAPFGLNGLTAITCEGWVKLDAAQDARIFDRSTAGQDDGWLFDVWLGKLRFNNYPAGIDSITDMPINKITHVAATFDGQTTRLYIDGVENNAKTLGGSATLLAPNLPLRIGGANNGSSHFRGLIDELAIYSRALTPAEIKAIFDAGANGRCK